MAALYPEARFIWFDLESKASDCYTGYSPVAKACASLSLNALVETPEHITRHSLGLWPSHNTGVAPFLGRAETPAEEGSVQLWRSWLDRCVLKHLSCLPIVDTRLPDRVLDVGIDDSSVRLLETAGTISRYMALSHCWGKVALLQTTKTSLQSHLAGIPFDLLPKTFRDAVTLCRDLGFRYIWIDSLCIVQDDEADWQEQRLQMTSIYENSALTIAASAAEDATQGLFCQHGRSRPDVKICDIALALSGNATNTTVTLRLTEPRLELAGSRALCGDYLNPLSQRAWAMQERLLPQCIIHFGVDSVGFECATSYSSDDSRYQRTGAPGSVVYRSGRPAEIAKIAFASDDIPLLLDNWYLVVTEYSQRHLTKGSDRLPAMSGISRILASKLRCRYLVGLWEADIACALSWEPTYPALYPLTWEQPPTVDPPSWSWANAHRSAKYIKWRCPAQAASDTWSQGNGCVGFNDAQVGSISGDDTFGLVRSAALTLVGRVTEIYIANYRGRVYEIGPFTGLHPRREFILQEDRWGERDYHGHGYVALLLWYHKCFHYECLVSHQSALLILEPAAGSVDVYRRIGIVHQELKARPTTSRRDFLNGKLRRITII